MNEAAPRLKKARCSSLIAAFARRPKRLRWRLPFSNEAVAGPF